MRYIFVFAVAIFVTWHYYPTQTEKAGHTIADKSKRAGKELLK